MASPFVLQSSHSWTETVAPVVIAAGQRVCFNENGIPTGSSQGDAWLGPTEPTAASNQVCK